MNITNPHTSSEAQEHRTWIFQANPKYYDLADALKKKKSIRWEVAQFKEDIHQGDTVYLWLSGSEGGLLARCVATTEPMLESEFEEEEEGQESVEEDAEDENEDSEDEDAEESDDIYVDIRIEEVFAKPLTRQACLDHPILRSMTIIRNPRGGTNFRVSPQEAAILAEITGFGSLTAEFAKYREDPYNRFVVQLRRTHAAQLRQFLSEPDKITLDWFNKEVWWIESCTRFGNEETKVYSSVPPDASRVAELQLALDENRLELHGNYIWGSAARIYGSGLKTGDDQKVDNIRKALGILNDQMLTPLQKAEQIRSVPGFGDNTATGVVMVYHPSDFAISNKQSNEALEKLGMKASSLSEFQDKVKSLRDELGADDYLELDWFLFLVNQGKYKPAGHTSIPKPPVKPNTRYWVMSLGEGARLWEQCRTEGIVALGWDHLGDMSQYSSKEDFAKAISKQRNDDTYPTNDALACYQFTYEMKPGDVVLAKQGTSRLYGCGTVESEYRYEPDRSEYRNVRTVKWLKSGNWEIPKAAHVPQKTLTDVTDYEAFLDFALPLMKQKDGPTPPSDRTPYTVDDALEDLFFSKDQLQDMLASLARKKNVILQGPPGVGKTFIARRLAYALIGFEEPAQVAMVQFHQSYAYEDFVQGWRPKETGGFERRNGAFYTFCKKAQKNEEAKYVFIIDEINRGNLSKIFGELMMLIETDKRGQKYAIPLTYSNDLDDTFFVPDKLHIIGMMNTADRSLAMVDYALRRRFTFVDLKPAFETTEFRSFLEEKDVESEVIDIIISRMTTLNELICSERTNLGPGFTIGHSFFCPQETEEELGMDWYRSVICSEIAPLIREYWFDATEKAEEVISKLLE